jgi:hypothetical protein
VVFDDTLDFDLPETTRRWEAGLRGRRCWWDADRARVWHGPDCLPVDLDWCVGHRTLEWHLPGWYCRRAVAKRVGFAKCTPQGCPRYEAISP